MRDEAKFGIYRGRVVENNDPINSGRVIALVPSVLGEQRSNWAVPLIRANSVPKINDIVFVQFLDGDISSPVYTHPSLSLRDLNAHQQSAH